MYLSEELTTLLVSKGFLRKQPDGEYKALTGALAPRHHGKPANGVVLYDGPSVITGHPIVAIATCLIRKSQNAKTAALVQTYILAKENDPVRALQTGRDEDVCGSCPHRPGWRDDGSMIMPSCYVGVGQAPRTVWRAFRAGKYPSFNPEEHLALFAMRKLRLGTYGDPAAVPLSVWEQVVSVAEKSIGFTHQWRSADRRLADLCMASVESVEDRRRAASLGYRTFRIRLPGQPLDAGQFVCPASDEARWRRTCEACMACSGSRIGVKRASPVIFPHGTTGKAERCGEVIRGLKTATYLTDNDGRISLL